MCWACEEAAMYYRGQLLKQIARGGIPTGLSDDDLRAMDLPLPGEIVRIEQPDGTIVLRKATPPAFVCDSPDE